MTERTRQVRVTGTLDMIRHSARTFGLRLADGTQVRCVAGSGVAMEVVRRYLARKVLVLGEAVYRRSGRLLRIDATAVEAGEGQPSIFERVPPPASRQPAPVREKRVAAGKRGVAAFFGIWPGDETDAEFEAMLREVRP